MTKRKNNKRALIVSALSLLLCVSMLVGSTMAWFTDNASTNVNKIEAGTLDIQMLMKENNEWVDAEGKTLSFVDQDGTVTWEPGARHQLQDVKLVNNGSLWAKCKVVLNYIDDDATDGVDLGDVIDVYIDNAPAGTLSSLSNIDNVNEFNLEPSKEETYGTIKLIMQEGAGNEYQGKSISGIAITVQATQASVEKDSIDEKYDEKAVYGAASADVTVANGEELKDAIANAGTGDVIGLESGTYNAEELKDADDVTFVIAPGENVTLDLGTDSITTKASSNDDEVKINEPTVLNQGNLTIEGGTISNKNATAGNTNVAAVKNVSGTLTLKNTTIENVAPTSGGAYAVVVSGGKVVLDNCSVKGGRGGIAVSGNGSVEMTGGTVTAGKYYPLYIMGTGNSTFNNVTFTNTSRPSIYNEFKEGEGTATFTNCTFNNNGTKVYNNNMAGLNGIS